MNEETPKTSTLKQVLKEIVIFLIIAGGIVVPFRIYVAEPYLVDGRSMDPTFSTGDYLIVDKISKNARFPERNAVVVFDFPNDTSKSFIKRIIGLPGETVVIKNNSVTIINSENPDGFELLETYIKHEGQGFYQRTLEGDEYFVMGDNRAESYDSRYWGPLKRSFILGRPLVRLLPINQIDLLPGSLNK